MLANSVLGVENVGTRDNFFDLGGDSLLLVRAAALLGERLRRRVEVVKLFEHPTIETLAAHLSATSGGNGVHDEIAARATRQRGAFLATRRR